jgi:hypothetical protein
MKFATSFINYQIQPFLQNFVTLHLKFFHFPNELPFCNFIVFTIYFFVNVKYKDKNTPISNTTFWSDVNVANNGATI